MKKVYFLGDKYLARQVSKVTRPKFHHEPFNQLDLFNVLSNQSKEKLWPQLTKEEKLRSL